MNKRLALPIFLTVFTDLIGFGMIITFLPLYAGQFGASNSQAAYLMAAFSAAQFLMAPFWGRLSDRYGRRPILITSLSGAILGYLVSAHAPSLAVLFAARLFTGAMAGNLSAVQAYLADITTPENRAKAMGLFGAAFGIGMILGPALGGALVGHQGTTHDFVLPFYVAAGLSLTALLMTLFWLKESLSPEIRATLASRPAESRWASLHRALRRPWSGFLIAVFFLLTFAFAGVEMTFVLWASDRLAWGPSQIGYAFAGIGLVAALIQGGMTGRLTKKFGEPLLLTASALITSVGIALIPMNLGVHLVLLGLLVMAVGKSLALPSILWLISRSAPVDEQGGTLGASQSSSSLARTLGPAWAGWGIGLWGLNFPFWSGVFFMGLMFLILAPNKRGLETGLASRPV